MDKKLLIIGGSPCSGKSTVAERITRQYGAYYYKVDDFLDEFIDTAATKGCAACKKVLTMTPDEIWMREPYIQCEEEFHIYDEIAESVFGQLKSIDANFIVTEGAAYTPRVMRKYSCKGYMSIVPTPDFQIAHYQKREWVPYVLEGCTDKKRAFDNWMERDILFAKQVKSECEDNGIYCVVNDGSRTEHEMLCNIKEYFGLI